jgi:biopolymer transport protein ExbD
MISLADIAFLIIFFFMLSSTFMRDQRDVPVPVLPRSDATDSQTIVIVDKDARIFLNGQAIGSPDALERELKGALADRVSSKDTEVRLRCDKRLPYSKYKSVFEAISHAGGVIAIMHDTPGGRG